MPVTEYIVTNVSDVVSPPGRVYDVAGVDIDPGQARNLLELGATLEQIARDENLAQGLALGELIGPAQTWYFDETNAGDALVPGGVYLYAPTATAAAAFTLPPAELGAQVPLPVEVINTSTFDVSLALTGGNSSIPAAPLTVPAGGAARLFTYFDGSAWGWSLTLTP